MQKPHDSLFEKNPSFAELYPRLQSRLATLSQESDDKEFEKQVTEVYRQWTRLTIIWDELQLLLVEKPHEEFARSLDLYIAKAQSEDVLREELDRLQIQQSHAFLPDPQSMEARLEILSDMLAVSLNEKLAIFKSLEDTSQELDLTSLKESRDLDIVEYEEANIALAERIDQLTMDMYQETLGTLENHTYTMENVKHGTVERFTDNYLTYHEVASSALLEKVERSVDATINAVYTPEIRHALAEHSDQMRRALPSVQKQLNQINAEIQEYEQAKTPAYVEAVEHYQRLKSAVEQADGDVDRLMHYKIDR